MSSQLPSTTTHCHVLYYLGMDLLAVISFVILYLATVRILRYRRRDYFLRKYGFHMKLSTEGMSLDEAFAIVRDLAELEFPTIFSGSVFFALFKVCVPT